MPTEDISNLYDLSFPAQSPEDFDSHALTTETWDRFVNGSEYLPVHSWEDYSPTTEFEQTLEAPVQPALLTQPPLTKRLGRSMVHGVFGAACGFTGAVIGTKVTEVLTGADIPSYVFSVLAVGLATINGVHAAVLSLRDKA